MTVKLTVLGGDEMDDGLVLRTDDVGGRPRRGG